MISGAAADLDGDDTTCTSGFNLGDSLDCVLVGLLSTGCFVINLLGTRMEKGGGGGGGIVTREGNL